MKVIKLIRILCGSRWNLYEVRITQDKGNFLFVWNNLSCFWKELRKIISPLSLSFPGRESNFQAEEECKKGRIFFKAADINLAGSAFGWDTDYRCSRYLAENIDFLASCFNPVQVRHFGFQEFDEEEFTSGWCLTCPRTFSATQE